MTFLLETLVRASAVVLVGLAIAWLLRRQPAALRHWVVGTTLLFAALQPAFNLVMPAWVLDASRPAPVVTAASPEPGVETAATFEVVRSPAQPLAAVDAGDVLIAIWLGGTALSLGAIAGGMAWLVWLGRRASAAGVAWIEEEQRIRALLGIRRRVRIRVTRHPALLVTWGLFRPSIMLPADANTWDPDRIAIVLAHELAHLRRGDWLSQVGAEIVRAICWFNPLFWLACAQLRRESELACDDVVLELGVARTSYATHLVEIARSFSRYGRTWLPAPSMARPSTLERRVRVMLNPHVNRRPASLQLRGGLTLLLLAMALPIAAAA